MEPLNQPDDMDEPDEVEDEQPGTRCNTVLHPHNIVERGFTNHAEANATKENTILRGTEKKQKSSNNINELTPE